MPTTPPDGRSVKSKAPATPDSAADRHERAKDYLSPGEMVRLLDAAKNGRHGLRDHVLLLMTDRHGLRVSEAIGIRRDELDLDRARIWLRRLKGGLSVEPPIAGDELRAIKRHLATCTDALPWLFVPEPLCANDHETKHPAKFRLRGQRRLSGGDAECVLANAG